MGDDVLSAALNELFSLIANCDQQMSLSDILNNIQRMEERKIDHRS